MMENIDLNFKVYSFDIFDTLVTRFFLRPVDLFYELGCRLSKDGLIDCDPKKFQQDRIIAEKKARELTKLEDVTFDEIYKFMLDYSNIDLLKKYEIDLELSSTSPIHENISLLKKLIKLNKKIIIVSDMYLSKDIIKRILIKNGISISDTYIYVSSGFGLTKRTGNLFEAICKINDFKKNEVIHIGNDWKSDCKGAKKAGLNYHYYKNWKNNKYEKFQDGDISSLGVSRALRLKDNEMILDSVSLNCIAPILYDYVNFIIKKSIDMGLKELLFLSRDGQIFYKIAKKIIDENSIDIQVKYIHASRKLLSYPSVEEFNLKNLSWLIKDSENNLVSDIIDRLELNEYFDDIINFFGENKQVETNDLNLFIENFKNSNIESYVLSKAIKYRENFINYLKVCEVNFENIVIVDIGWRLNIQYFFKKSIEIYFSRKINVTGFYLGVNFGHLPLDQVGNVFSFVKHSRSDVYSMYTNDYFFKKPSIMILEHIFCCADHSPLKVYPENGYIGFHDEVDDMLRQDVIRIHDMVLHYTETRVRFISFQSSEFINVKNALNFIFNPNPKQVFALGNFILNKDLLHNEKYSKSIVYPIYNLGDLNKSDWVYGSVSISSFWIRFLLLPLLFFKRSKVYFL